MRKPDLIMMSTHGRRGFRRLALGSVAESVLRLESGAREREAVNAQDGSSTRETPCCAR
jgi:hypothetical protein